MLQIYFPPVNALPVAAQVQAHAAAPDKRRSIETNLEVEQVFGASQQPFTILMASCNGHHQSLDSTGRGKGDVADQTGAGVWRGGQRGEFIRTDVQFLNCQTATQILQSAKTQLEEKNMWFARDYTKSLKGKNKNQTLPMRAKRSFVVIVAAALLWMTGTQPIASVTRSSRQTTSKPRSGAPQKPGLPRPSQPSNTPLRAKFHFMKNAAGNGILQCDTSTGTVKRVTPSTAIPPAGATGQYMFVVFGAEDIKACNVITGNCYTAPKSVN